MRTGMRVGGEVKECRGGLSVRPYPKNPEKTVELCIRNATRVAAPVRAGTGVGRSTDFPNSRTRTRIIDYDTNKVS